MYKKFFLLSSFFLAFTVITPAGEPISEIISEQQHKEFVERISESIERKKKRIEQLKKRIEQQDKHTKELLEKTQQLENIRDNEKLCNLKESLEKIQQLENVLQNDNEILKELPDSSLAKGRCVSYKSYWDRCFDNKEESQELCNIIASGLRRRLQSRLFKQLDKKEFLLESLSKEFLLELLSTERIVLGKLLKDDQPEVIDPEIQHFSSTVDRLMKDGPRKK